MTAREGSETTGGGARKIALLPGDGVGPEVIAEAAKVLRAADARWGLGLELVALPWSADHYLATGETLPAGALDRFREDYAAILLGAFGDPRVPDMKHARDILLGIRFGLDLYINFRPVKLYDVRLSPLADRRAEGVDFVVFRENTEGAYVGVGGIVRKGTADEIAIQEEVHTRRGVERILRAAFDWARDNGRAKVTMSDKANVMRHAHDLWQRAFREVAADYPEIEAEHMYVDALAMQMVLDPRRFDVIVTNNMFGDILTDVGAAIQGGLGLAASANLHPGAVSMFEPVHGSAPPLAGTGTANPVAAILSAGLMLATLGHDAAARAVEEAVRDGLLRGRTTRDLGGTLATAEVGDEVAAAVAG